MSAAKKQGFVRMYKQLRMSEHGDVLLVLRRQSRDRIVNALRDLRACCLPPMSPQKGDDNLDAAMRQMTFWPSEAELQELDLAVMELEMLEREKPPTPFWKAYELVNRRLPGIGLISGVNALVNRASQRLKEAESDLERLRRKASDDVPEAKRLLKGLQAIYKDASNASTFQWEDYEGLFDGNKPFRLPYGDSAPRGVRCYMRALQLIVDDLHYRQLLFQARPLLKWIVNRGNPDYIRRPEWGCLPLLYEYWTAQQSRETKSRKRELARIRKQKQWARENRSKKPKAPKKHAKNARPILGAATRQRRISDRSAVAKFA